MYKFDEEAHRHLLDGKPVFGTTTLIKAMFPPQLTAWASGVSLKLFGWLHPTYNSKQARLTTIEYFRQMIEKLSDEEYDDLLQRAYKETEKIMKDAGAYGSDAHGAIETAVLTAIRDNGGLLQTTSYDHPAVERFARWGRGKKFLLSEVNTYSRELRLGGVVDLVYEEDGAKYIGDIKTSRDIYPEHFIQMGLYDVQQRESGFVTSEGSFVHEPILDIQGYTVINIPRADEGEMRFKTYRNVESLRKFGRVLVESYLLKLELNTICKPPPKKRKKQL